MFEHLIQHDDVLRSIIQRKIESKRGNGKYELSYIDQIIEKYVVVGR